MNDNPYVGRHTRDQDDSNNDSTVLEIKESQGKWKRVVMVREKSGNLRHKEESLRKVKEFL